MIRPRYAGFSLHAGIGIALIEPFYPKNDGPGRPVITFGEGPRWRTM